MRTLDYSLSILTTEPRNNSLFLFQQILHSLRHSGPDAERAKDTSRELRLVSTLQINTFSQEMGKRGLS